MPVQSVDTVNNTLKTRVSAKSETVEFPSNLDANVKMMIYSNYSCSFPIAN